VCSTEEVKTPSEMQLGFTSSVDQKLERKTSPTGSQLEGGKAARKKKKLRTAPADREHPWSNFDREKKPGLMRQVIELKIIKNLRSVVGSMKEDPDEGQRQKKELRIG